MLAVGALFCLSGAAALVYQVAWQRILALASGVGIYSVAVIVGAFMAGLGIGSRLGGALSARMSPAAALRAFALLELGIAAFALVSVPLYYDLLYVKMGWVYAALWRATFVHLAALLPPTVLMGMSLPFLVRAMVRDVAGAGGTIGFLYGINVVGAALGAMLAPWVFIRHWGIGGAVFVGAALNALVGSGALLLGRYVAGEAQAAPGAEEPAAPATPPALWIVLYAASGFCALSLEILWFRLMEVAVKSTAFTFGTVLAVYLLGSAVGSLAGARLVARVGQPLTAFLACQCLLLILSALAVVGIVMLPADLSATRWLMDYWAGPSGMPLGHVWNWPALLRVYLALPLALYGLPTVLMGLSFPILQRAVQNDPRTSGHKVGLLQAANIAGCVAGSLLVGLVALNWFGTPGTLRLLLCFGLVFAGLGLRRGGAAAVFAPLGLALAVLIVVLPGERALWLRLHGLSGGEAFFDEDATALVALTPEDDGRWRMSVNGTSNSWLPYGGVHTWLGAIPAIVHPEPRDVAIIGLASGDTAWGAACRRETRNEVVFEICSPQLRLLRAFAARPAESPALRGLLSDPRVRIVVADGRHALERESALYDVIELDALRPYHAGSGNLYSLEFFESCRRHLKPGGVMCTWAPTPRTYGTFLRAFPYVLDFVDGKILVGSSGPLDVDLAAWRERLGTTRGYLGAKLADGVGQQLTTARPPKRMPRQEPDTNRDLFPRDEFATPRRR
jgi:predicted membrane-bound spermidine synthase